MAERPLPAYDGDEPYIFVAYSHEDSDLVYPQIRWLQDHGFNVGWDEGISPGAVWRREVAEAIRSCSLLLYFTTPNSVASEHCTREVNFALDEHHRPVLAVHLIETVLPDALALSLSDRQAIYQHTLEPEDYERKLVSAVATYLDQPVPAISLRAPARKSARQVSWPLAFVGSLIVGVVAVLVTWFQIRPDASTPSGMQSPLTLQHFSYHPTQFRKLALSPDGRQIAYVGVEAGETFLYVKNADAPRADKFPGTSGAEAPFFSPDGKWIGFQAHGQLKRSPAAGGNPVHIASHPNLQRGLSWGDDGFIVFSPTMRAPLNRVAADGGVTTAVTHLDDYKYAMHKDPFVLPGSKQILYQRSSVDGEEIWLKDLVSGKSRRLIQGQWPQYDRGKLLFFRGGWIGGGSIWTVDFNPDTLTINGDATPLVEESHSPFSISNSGDLIYSVPSPPSLRLLLLDQAKSESQLIVGESIFNMRFSPDGQSLAIPRTLNGKTNIWIFDLETNQPTQWSFDGGRTPIWSPDGEKLAYFIRDTGIVERRIDASEAPTVLVDTDANCFPLQWTDQGLLYMRINPNTQADLYFRANSGEQSVIENDQALTPSAHISPNGEWIAISRYESGEWQVYVEPFPERGSRRIVNVVNANMPKWAADGTVLYVASYNRVIRVPVTAHSKTISFGEYEVIRELGSPAGITFFTYDVSPDERRIALMDVAYPDPPVQMFVTNWPKLLLD